MRHPEFLIVPVLMLCDYALTVAGAKLRERGYAEHFTTQHYELNPVWQAAIAQKRWFNARHLAITALVGLILYVLGEWLLRDDDALAPFLTGFFVGMFGAVIGRHLGNLATFAYIARAPQHLSGTVAIRHELMLWMSVFQCFALIVPLLLLALYRPTPPVLGAFAGSVMLVLVHLLWIRRFRRAAAAAAAVQQS